MSNRPSFVDQSECTSCNLCADTVPAVFRMDSNDLAEVHDPEAAPEKEIQQAMDDCPAECIHWGKSQSEWKAEHGK